MNLKRQLLLVSLLTLVLPWAGCEFIRETESALRDGQQQMLAGTARAIADSLKQYPEEFPVSRNTGHQFGDQLYGHPLETRPVIDGYVDDWSIDRSSLRLLRGTEGPARFVIGLYEQSVYLYVEVADKNVVYASAGAIALDDGPRYADRVNLVSTSPPYLEETIAFAAEAPGPIVSYLKNAYGFAPVPTIQAHWQDVPGGYQIEARIPVRQLGTNLGLVVTNTSSPNRPGARSASFATRIPGPFVSISAELGRIAASLVQPGMRLMVTDPAGWRIASVGSLTTPDKAPDRMTSGWMRIAYDALVESGKMSKLAEPDASGREQQTYIVQALDGKRSESWFRSSESGIAIVAVAEPVLDNGAVIGSIILQQSTDAILSLTNQGLARLITVSLSATIFVAITLLGYATWLSRRIRRLSVAAEEALDGDDLRATLPSAHTGDEIGDLSRSFSYVLGQLGDYNDYLRSLAAKLSHELRTPLAIVTSSLENLEHEPLNPASAEYAARAKDGADRLRRILTAMSEASRVEELMQHAEPEEFDLCAVLHSTVSAYRDAYGQRQFAFDADVDAAPTHGSPELLIQMLDKLVDNAVDFSSDADLVSITLRDDNGQWALAISNPGPSLPERMQTQMFDSMVSVRSGGDGKHLGLGLYIARLIAEGHGGSIAAANIDGGVTFVVSLPAASTNTPIAHT
jgi:dedicated sortase system histidine kinase